MFKDAYQQHMLVLYTTFLKWLQNIRYIQEMYINLYKQISAIWDSIYRFFVADEIDIRSLFFSLTGGYQRDRCGSIYSCYREKSSFSTVKSCPMYFPNFPFITSASTRFPREVKAGIACLPCIRVKTHRIRAVSAVYAKNSQCVWVLSFRF